MSSPPTSQFVHFSVPCPSNNSDAGNRESQFGTTSYDFLSPSPFEGPLLPTGRQWPTFDTAVMYMLSPAPSPASSYDSSPSPTVEGVPLPDFQFPPTFPSSAALASMPIPPSRGSSRNKSPDHVPRPRNAFMLFRSAFAAAQKITTNIEHDNRHITRIIAHCWNHLSAADKKVWRDKAAAEKAQHAQRYPNYRFSPVCRANKPVKRNVRRNGVEDKKRCEKVAELLLAGKNGKELESAVKEIDVEFSNVAKLSDRSQPLPPPSVEKSRTFNGWHPREGVSEDCDIPPFRSPLLPPIKAASVFPQEIPDRTIFLPPLASITAPPSRFFQPQGFYPTDPSTSDVVLPTTFWEYHYHEPNMRDGVPSPRSISPPGNFQPIMDFLRHHDTVPELSVPDFSNFSWNESDSFMSTNSSSSSYYH
ncbi:hypothetical protein BS17DRAFT_36673 [Gyrodon lividus]|nr:hypothetical protein BS17DRAFT_36673 [Gyrodon lividus]